MMPRNQCRVLAVFALLSIAAPVWAQPSQDLGSYALFALSQIRSKGLMVASGNVGVNNARGILFASRALEAPTSDVAASIVRIFPTSECDDLFAEIVSRSGPGCGNATTFTPPIIADVPAACGFPAPFPACGGNTVTVRTGENRTLPPGTYGAVAVKGGGGNSGTLVLQGGDYVFCSLELGRAADLLFAGAARVQVTGDVTFGNGTTVGPANGSAVGPADADLFVNGSDVHFSRRSRVNATLCAPNAALRLTQGTRLNGTFVAKFIRADRVVAMTAPPSSSTTTSSTTTTSTSQAPTTTGTTSTSTTTPPSTTTVSTSTATTTSQTTSTATSSTVTSTTTIIVVTTTSTTGATTSTTTTTAESTTTVPSTTTTQSTSTTTGETTTTGSSTTQPSSTSTTSVESTTTTVESSTTTTTVESTTTTTVESTTTTTTEGTTTSTTEGTTTTLTTTSTTTTSTTETTTTTLATTTTSTTVTTTTTTSTTETTTTSTSTTTTSTSTTSTTLACCPSGQIVTNSNSGVLLVSTLAPFPFPAGVITTVNVGVADPATCKHNVIVPAGGFSVPVFCIPALGFTSQVTAAGCESGGADGTGMVWDASAPCPDAEVTRVGDTTDPDGNSCGTLGAGCLNPVTSGSAGADTAGNINTTRGDGACDTADGVHTQLDIPVLSTTWNDIDGNCPDDDLQYDPGTDTLVTQFNFILSPTTAATSANYEDLNSDACSFAGNGPDHTKRCSLDSSRPCATNGHCTNPPPNAGTCIDGPTAGSPAPIIGTPATGPCCVPGQSTTVVATGIAFTGGAPLYDILFANKTPSSITQCNDLPSSSETCVLTTNPCQD